MILAEWNTRRRTWRISLFAKKCKKVCNEICNHMTEVFLSYLSWNIKVMHNNFILFYNDICDYSSSTRTARRKLVTPAFQCIGRVNSLELYEMHYMKMHDHNDSDYIKYYIALYISIMCSMLKTRSETPQNSP